MKGKHWEEKDPHANNPFPNMHHNPNFHHHYHHNHHFQTSSEQEEKTSTHTTTITTTTKHPPTAGATTKPPMRRPRGRPPGSKNKPKPPIFITRIQPEPTAMMRPCILEIPTGLDLINSITQFSKKRNTSLCVLSATGAVTNVTLRQPNVTLHGRFDLLSLSATVFPSPTTTSFLRGSDVSEFCVSLGCPRGQVVGGTVVGPLYAAATVNVVAMSFDKPLIYRLPVEEEGEEDGEDNEGRSSPPVGCKVESSNAIEFSGQINKSFDNAPMDICPELLYW